MTSALKFAAHPDFSAIWAQVEADTTASQDCGFALWAAVNAAVDSGLTGCFVECGECEGGTSRLIALTLLSRGERHRELFLFDTFEGKTTASSPATDPPEAQQSYIFPYVSNADTLTGAVRDAVARTGYDMRLVRLVKGTAEETLPHVQTLRIALLRLSTTSCETTLAALRHLYPRLSHRGMLIIDYYDAFAEVKTAVDTFFADPAINFSRPVLWVMGNSGRGAVKTDATELIEIARYDYIPPRIELPDLRALFPFAEAQNPWQVKWPYLRPQVPHLWRSDTRNDTPYTTGNASVEEAACLFEFARQFAGKRGLEIGTHYGWTAAHLLAAGLNLDCVDPEFLREIRVRQVAEALDQVPERGQYRLWAGRSPDILEEVRASQPDPWSFAFIDGSHDGTGPADDARGVLPFLAPDAVVVFHDLTSPHVEAGLAVFREAGFATRILNTMQILGVAWRGEVKIFDHLQDENIAAVTIGHLNKYLSSESANPVTSALQSERNDFVKRNLLDRLTGKNPTKLAGSDPVAIEPAESRPPVRQDAPTQTEVATVKPVASKPTIWENLVCLNSDAEPDFSVLGPARDYRANDARLHEWAALDYQAALDRDTSPLPETADREGYYGPDHFSYWASGLADARHLLDAATAHGVDPTCYLDLGCASGRVLRHMAYERPGLRALGCDINRLHVEWCNRYLPSNCTVFQNHSIPSLPLPDNSVSVISAYSVFTHIEALETAWLMELNRILQPGGIAWITVHSELTLHEMDPNWPLWNPIMLHPEAATKLDAQRNFAGDRLILRWRSDISYSSNIFYKLDYLKQSWGRIFEIVEVRRRFPAFQDVLILRKRP